MVFRNSFEKGLDMDTSKLLVAPNTYTDAHNVTLTEDGAFWALKNINGPALVDSLTGTITDITDCTVKIVPTKYKIGSVEGVNCITAFIIADVGSTDTLYVTVYDLDNGDLYYLYKQEGLSGYFDLNRVIDAIVYPENGIDYIYFEDDFNEGRQLRCEIPAASPDYFVTDFDLSLQRWGANGAVRYDEVGTGSLLSGTYQFAYRLLDPTKKRFTRWSSLSNPFHIYINNPTVSTEIGNSSAGMPTAFSIKGNVEPTTEEVDNFDYYQLAVVENVYGINTPIISASLLPITALTSISTAFEYKSNDKIGLVPITDITVDTAAIQSAKTLAVKQNRLFRGNLNYVDLSFDNGEPAITSGSVAVTTVTSPPSLQNDIYCNPDYSSTIKGYFRDEVYRFGVVYKDKYGNKFPVKVLDLHTLTNNQISGSLTDVRFPARSTSNAFTLFDSSDRIRVLGLNLVDLHNHPTNAVSLEIVRAKRLKRIQFQTPVIPMTYVEGIGAFEKYPSQAKTSGGTTDFTSVTPQTTSRVYTPKNLFWPEMRNIHRRTTGNGGAAGTLSYPGEVNLSRLDTDGGSYNPRFTYAMIFPPASMYGDTPFEPNHQKLESIDLVATRSTISDFDSASSFSTGDYIKTRVGGTFHALEDELYYFDSTFTGKSLSVTPKPYLIGYAFLDNLSPGTTLAGGRIGTYSELTGTNINWGFEQKLSRAAYVQLSTPLSDVSAPAATTVDGNASAFVFAAGTLNFVADAAKVFGGTGPAYQASSATTNAYINKYASYADSSSVVGALRIVNVVNDYSDDRYGDVATQHEFISTGASYEFTESELVDVRAGNTVNVDLTVYGGDCFIAAHTFKVNDTWYSVTNQSKNLGTPANDSTATLWGKWDGRYYENSGPAAISIPVALEGAAQFVQVMLESEYNGGVMAEDIVKGISFVNGFPVVGISSTSNKYADLRTPLVYNYNLNISKENDQRVYFPKPSFSFDQTSYKARVAYSDVKIYGSDTQGFDIIRVGNFNDLEESRGGITKLAIEGDSMYGIQERGIVYIPVGGTQIETTDAGILAIGTGDVIGRVSVIDQKRGGQSLSGIVETGNAIYIADAFNNSIYRLENRQLAGIEGFGMRSTFRDLPVSQLITVFDAARKQLWVQNNADRTCYVFSEPDKMWISNYETYRIVSDETGIHPHKLVAAANDDKLYLAMYNGNVFDQVTLWSAYDGDPATWWGLPVEPRVTFVVNPAADVSKIFTNQAIQATAVLGDADYAVDLVAQAGTKSLAVSPVQGHYKIKLPRDSGSRRLIGTHMSTTINWKIDTSLSAVSSVLTKFRLSSRTPF